MKAFLNQFGWQSFALGSAFFAALTAIFGKIGVANINSNLATFIRTVVIFFVIGGIITSRSEWQSISHLTTKPLVFLILSGIATGLSWLCYYHALQIGPVSRVAPIDKISVAIVIALSAIFLGEPLTWKVLLGGALVTTGALVLAL